MLRQLLAEVQEEGKLSALQSEVSAINLEEENARQRVQLADRDAFLRRFRVRYSRGLSSS